MECLGEFGVVFSKYFLCRCILLQPLTEVSEYEDAVKSEKNSMGKPARIWR